MSAKLFKVVLTGKIRAGFTRQQVRANLESQWPSGTRQLERLFAGLPVTLKKGLNRSRAAQVRAYFRRSGAECRVLPQTASPDVQASGGASAKFACPKCGLSQSPTQECIGCGIYFARYKDLQERRGGAAPASRVKEADPANSTIWIRRQNIAFLSLLVSMILFIAALFMQTRLPDANKILPSLYKMPRQSMSQALAFDTRMGGRSYHITPLFDYELWGLVVSYYDSTGWWDFTHKFLWRDFINIKDLCVLYGLNVRNDAYKEMGFKSGSYTCHAKLKTERAQLQFFSQCLSNNHLLSDNPRVQKAVMRAKPGDQIYLKGYLVGYGFTGQPPTRFTSTTRNDTGDGACESIYLTEFKILRTGNPLWRFVFKLATWAMVAAIVFLLYTQVRLYREASGQGGTLSLGGGHYMLKIIGQLLLLLLLLLMWARIH